jgi:hypothetical protein
MLAVQCQVGGRTRKLLVYCQDFVILHPILKLPRNRSVRESHLTRDVMASALVDRPMYQPDTIEQDVSLVLLWLSGLHPAGC